MISKKWQYLINAPFKISDACCDIMKKRPLDLYSKLSGRKSITGMMTEESNRRKRQYIKYGCNAFESKKPYSWPIAFWTEKDIWNYIKINNIAYSKVYDMGENRTGCMFCMFGIQYESEPNRFQRMKITHPKIYNYCMNKLGCESVLNYIGINMDRK